MKLLVLEPYDGGSHARFLDDLERELPFQFTRLSLPARGWKWRMRFGANHFARELQGLGGTFDAILVSTFLNLAELRAFLPSHLAKIPCAIYWHENQFAYPVRQADERDLHFAVTNLQSALAADLSLFNSAWNRESFALGARDLLRRVPDMRLDELVDEALSKSRVLPPLIQLPTIKPMRTDDAPLVLWNHRWEHDKNPETFFESLIALRNEGVSFRLAVAGQSFRDKPPIFETAQDDLSDHVVHWGEIENRHEYELLLAQATVAVSTATHEFYGLSLLEAALAGAWPLAPNRLAYPEIYPRDCLYEDGQLVAALRNILVHGTPNRSGLIERLEERTWPIGREQWIQVISGLADSSSYG